MHETTWLIRGARILDPASGLDTIGDVVIESGLIRAVGENAAQRVSGLVASHCIDGQGKWVVPGFVDLRAHLGEPGFEHREDMASGLRAAAAGGFTTVCATPNTKPVNDCGAVTRAMMHAAQGVSGARLGVMGAATLGMEGSTLSEMGDLREAGAIGVTDGNRCITQSPVMRRVLQYAHNFDLLVSQHAEDHDLTCGAQMHEGLISEQLGLRGWPREAEEAIVARDLILTEGVGGRYHLARVSSRGTLRLLREAKSRGLRVSAAATPHHLLLTEEALRDYDPLFKVSPPLRTEEDRAALVAALADGTIDCITTDHTPCTFTEKHCEFEAGATGMNGLEIALACLMDLVRNESLSAIRLIEALTAATRIAPELGKASLAEGSSADVTVIDPEARWVPAHGPWFSKTQNSPWLHRELQGRVQHTFVAGQRVHTLSEPS